MRRAHLALALLLAMLTGSAWGAYPTTDTGLDTYHAALRTYVNSFAAGKMRVWGVGDSWTSCGQYQGESGYWTSFKYAGLWADKAASHETAWMNRLSWRLGVSDYGAEAIGGASVCYNRDVGPTFTWKEDSCIVGWMDDAAEFEPDLAFYYGGINDMKAGMDVQSYVLPSAKWNCKNGLVRYINLLPKGTRLVVMTLQPVGRRALGYKANGSITATWREAFDYCYDATVMVDNFNTWLKDSLRAELKALDATIDTTKVFIHNQDPYLQADWTPWLTTRNPSSYLFNLGGVTGTPNTADSLKWANIRIPRIELESDSTHLTNQGHRQMGDSMAVHVFGLDLNSSDGVAEGKVAWSQPAAKTLYVNYQTGHNFKNRGKETSINTPLCTVQAAICRAWPGDTLHVVGSGNNSVYTTDDVTGLPVSSNGYEWVVRKPGLYLKFADGGYVQGIYSATARVFGGASSEVGSGLIHNTEISGGDGFELARPPAWSSTDRTRNALIDLGWMTIDGLRVLGGYETPLRLNNVTEFRLKDCEFIGGSNAEGAFQVFGYGYSDTTPDPLNIQIDGCTFWADSSNVTASKASSWGRVLFTRPNSSPISDSTKYAGYIKNSTFTGDARCAAAPLVSGWWDGMDFVGNTFTDPGSWAYVLENTRTGSATLPHNRVTHFINNTWSIGKTASGNDTTVVCVRYANISTAIPRQDSLIFINNWVKQNGGTVTNVRLFHGGLNRSKYWFARNIWPSPSRGVLNGNNAPQSLVDLATTSPVCAPDPTTDNWQQNWAGKFSATSDSMIFGGITTTTKGNTWKPSTYGVTHGTNHASVGATQYTGDPYVWASTRDSRPSYSRIDTPAGLLALIDNGVLLRSDSLDINTWYEFPQPRGFADEAMIKAYLTYYHDWAETDRKKIRWYIEGARYLVKAPPEFTGYHAMAGPWTTAFFVIDQDEIDNPSPTDPSTWIRFQQPRNAADRLMIDYYLKTWDLWPATKKDSIYFKVEGAVDFSLTNPGTTPLTDIYSMLASIKAPTGADTCSATSVATWCGWRIPRNEADHAVVNANLTYWDNLATDDKAIIKLKNR
ncbi:MAG: hypothetical protein FJ109_14150 [Deltaproteobacteria bacterium]|nr:hypothetical protein [Deltaproteobacteria bacterium]